MSVFLYPKTLHKRTQKPRLFKRYRSYKRFLQAEFSRLCVYCRQLDSTSPNLNFGVDHYRPKSIPRFNSLLCDYQNLYYCCGQCNSRKNNDWPLDEKAGPYVVNPCEHSMAEHLRFDASTGKIEPRTSFGRHTEFLLQLNDDASVQYRLGVLRIIKTFNNAIKNKEMEIDEVEQWFVDGKIDAIVRDAEILELQLELKGLKHTLHAHNGELPLPPITAARLKVALITP